MSDLRDGFFQECIELLEAFAEGMSVIEDNRDDIETINAMFRSVHSIKGGAAAFGLDPLVEFAHSFENVLDDLRSGQLACDDALLALLYQGFDHLSDLVEASRDGIEIDPAKGASILGDMKQVSAANAPEPQEAEDTEVEFAPLQFDLDSIELEPEGGTQTASNVYRISFAPDAELFRTGNEPALMFRALDRMGELEVVCDPERVPEFDALEPGVPYLSWTATLRTVRPIEEVEEVFEFILDQCELEIVPVPDAATQPGGSAAPTAPMEEPDPLPTSGDSDPEGNKEPLPPSSTGENAQRPREARSETIRVELDRVDKLINIVGELVIGEAMLRQAIGSMSLSAHSPIETALDQIKQLSGTLQESVMAIRAQPVRGMFQRMSRIAREAARAAGKNARLVTEGESTEVDKTVTERLVEPLTHMIRNAVDHGLEPGPVRVAAGKPERGTIMLSAAHRSGRVVIELRDDGAGINRTKVREIALNKGLIAAEDELTDGEIDNLLFLPGFSTADEVSSLSGRGVGMDVVRSEIQALGGRVSIASEPGKGTAVTISLPLTLAVLEGMVVDIGGETVVVPTANLRETMSAADARIHRLGADGVVLSMRDGLVPIMDLGEVLGFRDAPSEYSSQTLLLIEAETGRRTALAVDRIHDQREVVIKGLEQNYQRVPGIAASTILGDGRIALIVDTDQLTAQQRAISAVA